MIKINEIERNHWLVLALILLVAAVARMSDGGALTHFRYDQATLSQLALEMAHGESLPLLGIESSAGVPNSPMTVYFLAIPYFFTSNPQIVTMVIAAWNVLGVGLLWFIAHRYFDPRVAIIAGFAYAVAPFAVNYSRAIWAQDFHTPIILLAFLLAFLGFLEGKRWPQVLALPLLLIGVQIHFAAYTLLPIYLWIVFLGRRNIHWPTLGATIGLSVLTFVPFALGVANQPDSTSERASLIADILQNGVLIRWYPLEFIQALITGVRENGEMPLYALSWYALLAAFFAGLVLVWRAQWRYMAVTLWLWAGITLVAFIPAWTGSGVFRHYFIPSIPAFSLLSAIGFIGLLELLPAGLQRYGRYALAALLVVIFGTQLHYSVVVELDERNEYIVREGGQTSTPMHMMLDVREALQAYDDVILLGANPHESNYYVWEPMLYDSAECVRDLLISGGWVDILPDAPFAAVVAPLSPINAGYEVPARYQTDDPIVIPLREGEDPYIIYEFDEAPQWTESDMVPLDDAPTFENGVQPLGYALTPNILQVMWQLPEDVSNAEFVTYFAHFLNDAGEKIGQRDLPFYVPQHWCSNDRIVTSGLIELPPDTTTLRLGMYRRNADGGTTNLQVFTGDGSPVGTWVDIPLEDTPTD